MLRKHVVRALAVILLGALAFTIAELHYHDVVDNPRASGLDIAEFLTAYIGGIFGITAGASSLLAILVFLAIRRKGQ